MHTSVKTGSGHGGRGQVASSWHADTDANRVTNFMFLCWRLRLPSCNSPILRQSLNKSLQRTQYVSTERNTKANPTSNLLQPSSFYTRMASSLPDLPPVEGTDPSRCVLDAFRISAATRISKSLNIPLTDAFAGVDLGKKGNDFTVAVPRFRLKTKPDELAKKIVSDVSLQTSNILQTSYPNAKMEW